MVKVFVSYRRDDSSGHVGRLHDRLTQHFDPDDIFIDIAAIEPGEDFVEAIQRAVMSCDVLLAVIGRGWLNAMDAQGNRRLHDPLDFVRLEIATALQNTVRVIPVLVSDATMPAPAELPEDLQPLTRRQAIVLNDRDFHHHVDELIDVIDKQLIDTDANGEPPPSQTSLPNRVSRDPKEVMHREADVPTRALILKSALLGGVTIFAMFPYVEVVAGVVGWIVHALVTESILTRSGIIVSSPNKAITALMGAAASGLLLRRATPPASLMQVLYIAVGWVTAFFIVFPLVAVLKERFFWIWYDLYNQQFFWRFLLGALNGALGGGVLAFFAARR